LVKFTAELIKLWIVIIFLFLFSPAWRWPREWQKHVA
jgi:hypothetical protein